MVDKLEQRRAKNVNTNDNSVARPLDGRDIYRYRRQRGVNLGSWFVLEKWISCVPFHNAIGSASSDYDVACGPRAQESLEKHWDTWITDEDWRWISERGINSVRLPIGYYHLYARDQSVVQGTPFANLGHVFQGAWSRILDAVKKASSYGIGVLIDLHAAPGKQNADSHSGINGPVEFFKRKNLMRTIAVLKLLAATFAEIPNVIGIQLANEPQNNNTLPGWYRSALDAMRAIAGPNLPLYIHDAWSTHEYASLIHDRSDFVVLDHHLYRCFTPKDHTLSGEQHASALPTSGFEKHAQMTRGNFVVAEFSAALNPKSLQGSDAGEQDRQRRVFCRAELDLFERSCGGWWMWTYKKDGWDAGWSFRDTVRADIMPEWVGMRRDQGRANNTSKRDEEGFKALEQHTRYWSAHKGAYEHWRFEAGFEKGWEDAFMFFLFSPNTVLETAVSELGFMGQWVIRRTAEHVSAFGGSSSIWEFEHGFNQGVAGAKSFYMGQ
ncbi:glycoside hydrolase family 5 protein [Ramaria rubella]|nr:glycoside hydrolase family 5 protein [Ramaria rubella]